jgi:Ca-activated chloride channel family protein
MAIDSAIMTFANILKDSQVRSRIIIVIADGNNNMEEIDPLTADRFRNNIPKKIIS